MSNKFSADFKATLKVLVIDDVTSMRIIIINMLRKLGFTDIIEASNGKQGLKLIQSNKFDIVLCDWNMPKLDGLSLLKLIRLSYSTTTLPFIMVTSNQKLEDVKECINSRVSGFLLKPFSFESLDKVLDDTHHNILVHHKTQGLLTDEMIKALDSQTTPSEH